MKNFLKIAASVAFLLTASLPLALTVASMRPHGQPPRNYAFVVPFTHLGCLKFDIPDGDQVVQGWEFEQPVRFDLSKFKGRLTFDTVAFENEGLFCIWSDAT